MLKKGLSLNLESYVIDSLVRNAYFYDEDEFLCMMFNDYRRFSKSPLNTLLVSQIIRIVSQTNIEGSYIETIEKLINRHDSENDPECSLPFGVFPFLNVHNSILLCYLKDKRIKDAALV